MKTRAPVGAQFAVKAFGVQFQRRKVQALVRHKGDARQIWILRGDGLKTLVIFFVALAVTPIVAAGQFQFRNLDSKSIELTENGARVYVYNYGTMLKEGVAADRARCCYLHPVYAPTGVVVTDDFPEGELHHRGISWMWPVVVVDGKTYDLWAINGIFARFEKWERKKAGKHEAVLGFQDGWYVGERKVVQENVRIVVFPLANGRRDLNVTVALRSVRAQVTISGRPDHNKGYGGALEIRFAPRTDTKIRTSVQEDAPDSDRVPAAWAELTGNFGGKIVTTRVTEDASNPGAPNGWCLRHYGFVGVEYPGLELRRLDDGVPLTMRFRVELSSDASDAPLAGKPALVNARNGKASVLTDRR